MKKITDWLNEQKDYGMCNPPMDAQTALYFLADYLRIPDNSISESVQQTNTYLVFEILNRYSKKFRNEIKNQKRLQEEQKEQER